MKLPAFATTCAALFFSVVIVVLAQTPPLKESTPAMKSALTQVITDQITAFRANDYARAYTFASSDLRQIFAADAFAQMVQHGYPLIAHSTTTDFGVALDDGEEGVVFVRVGDAQGRREIYRYTLKLEKDGWKITGVSQPEPGGPSKTDPDTA